MARLYSNENFPLDVVKFQRELGHDVLTSYEAKKANQSIPDDDVLSFATEQERALLTINRRDFKVLHRKAEGHAGIIICTQDMDFLGQANRIHQAITKLPHLKGQLISIAKPNRK